MNCHAATAGAFAFFLFAGAASAQSHDRDRNINTGLMAAAPIDRLEKAFWDCDYMATTLGPNHTDVPFCSTATETLKRRKFEGDFERMLSWWKVNKAEQHAAARYRLEAR